MMMLDLLFLSGLLTCLLALVLAGNTAGRYMLTLMYALQLLLLLQIDPLVTTQSAFSITVLGQVMSWQVDGLSWFFALITLAVALLSSWYAAGEYSETMRKLQGHYRLLHTGLAVNVLAMMILLASGDFLSLFLGWELVSWAGVMLMVLGGKDSRQATLRYITYAIAGGMSILAGLVFVYSWTGSLSFAVVSAAFVNFTAGQWWLVTLLTIAGFSVKMGLMPFHLWQAPAYALTAGPASAFLGAISSRMGLFAIALVSIKMIGVEQLMNLS